MSLLGKTLCTLRAPIPSKLGLQPYIPPPRNQTITLAEPKTLYRKGALITILNGNDGS